MAAPRAGGAWPRWPRRLYWPSPSAFLSWGHSNAFSCGFLGSRCPLALHWAGRAARPAGRRTSTWPARSSSWSRPASTWMRCRLSGTALIAGTGPMGMLRSMPSSPHLPRAPSPACLRRRLPLTCALFMIASVGSPLARWPWEACRRPLPLPALAGAIRRLWGTVWLTAWWLWAARSRLHSLPALAPRTLLYRVGHGIPRGLSGFLR